MRILAAGAVCVVGLLAGLVSWIGLPDLDGESHGIVVTPQHFDWGQVMACDTAECVFRIENATVRDVRVLDVKTNCSCQSVEAPSVVPAKDARSLRVVIDTRGLSGPVTRRVTVLTDDPETPTLPATMSGVVVPFCSVQPRYLILSEPAGRPVSGSCLIQPTTNVELMSATIPSAESIPVSCDVSRAAGGFRLTVRGVMPSEYEHFRVPVKLETDDGVVRKIAILVSLKPLPRVSCSPRQAIVFEVDDVSSVGASRSVVLRATRPDVRFKVKRAACTSEFRDSFAVRVETLEVGRAYRVNVDLISWPDVAWFRDRLEVVIDDGGEETLGLAILGRNRIAKTGAQRE